MLNEELDKESPNQLLENFEKRKYQLSLKDNIQGAKLADMQLATKFNGGI